MITNFKPETLDTKSAQLLLEGVQDFFFAHADAFTQTKVAVDGEWGRASAQNLLNELIVPDPDPVYV